MEQLKLKTGDVVTSKIDFRSDYSKIKMTVTDVSLLNGKVITQWITNHDVLQTLEIYPRLLELYIAPKS